MSHTFRIPLTKPREQLEKDAASLLPEKGFTFVPDDQGGLIRGHGFEGSLRFVGQELEVEITKKPMIAPWPLVEAKIRSFFAG